MQHLSNLIEQKSSTYRARLHQLIENTDYNRQFTYKAAHAESTTLYNCAIQNLDRIQKDINQANIAEFASTYTDLKISTTEVDDYEKSMSGGERSNSVSNPLGRDVPDMIRNPGQVQLELPKIEQHINDYIDDFCVFSERDPSELKTKIEDEAKKANTSFTLLELFPDFLARDQINTNSCVGFTIGSGILDYIYNLNIYNRSAEKKTSKRIPIMGLDSSSYPLNDRQIRTINQHIETSPRFIWMNAKTKEFPGDFGVLDDSKGCDFILAAKNLLESRRVLFESDLPFLFESPTQVQKGSDGLMKIGRRRYMRHYDPRFVKAHLLPGLNLSILYNSVKTIKDAREAWDIKTIDRDWHNTVKAMKAWLMAIGPLGIEISRFHEFEGQKDVSNRNILIHKNSSPSLNDDGIHACSVVGFRTHDENPHFLIKNSWGSYWGQNGFIWIDGNSLRKNLQSIIGISRFTF